MSAWLFKPLRPEHPSVGETCWVCQRKIQIADRVALMSFQTPEETGSLTVEARVVHSTCKYRGRTVQTPMGPRVIDRIKDGDGSPYQVLTTDGRQWREEEIIGAD